MAATSTPSRLTLARVSELAAEDVRLVKSVQASQLGFTGLDDLSVCVNLTRLDVSHNRLQNLHGLEDAVHLTWINVAHNQLTNLDELARMRLLHVVNAGHNQLVRFDGLRAATELRALVLNDNKLLRLDSLVRHKALNSLIVSHNQIAALDGIGALVALTTLAAAHNQLRQLPSLGFAVNLEQLRLNDNKLVSISTALATNARLKLLDVGNNLLPNESALKSLQQLPALVNLNLKGNPVCETAGYPDVIRESIPSLRILDGQRFDKAFLRRKSRKQTDAHDRVADPVAQGPTPTTLHAGKQRREVADSATAPSDPPRQKRQRLAGDTPVSTPEITQPDLGGPTTKPPRRDRNRQLAFARTTEAAQITETDPTDKDDASPARHQSTGVVAIVEARPRAVAAITKKPHARTKTRQAAPTSASDVWASWEAPDANIGSGRIASAWQ